MKKTGIVTALFFFILAFSGCQKEEFVNQNDSLLLDQETVAEQLLVDLDALVDEAVDLKFSLLKSASVEGQYYLTSCPSIILNLTGGQKVMTIDFGESCKGKDGRIRSGKIIVTSTSPEKFAINRVKAFENFYVDGKKIEGKIAKNITLNREDHTKVAELEEDVTITFPDNAGKATRKALLTRDYHLNILGNPKDNVITSWGFVEFTRKSGLKVTKTITEANPLVFKMECHQVVSGIVTFNTSDNRTWTLDYGNGDCDNKAILTKNGESKEIKLK